MTLPPSLRSARRGLAAPGAFLFLLPLLGCASAADLAPLPRLGPRAIFLAPIEDRSGELAPPERARLADAIRAGLLDLARDDEKRRRPPLRVSHAPDPGTATATLALAIERFDPAGSKLAGFLLGFGAGRPGFTARIALGTRAEPLGDRTLEEASSRYGPDEATARARMLDDLAAEAVAFVRRRRRRRRRGVLNARRRREMTNDQ